MSESVGQNRQRTRASGAAAGIAIAIAVMALGAIGFGSTGTAARAQYEPPPTGLGGPVIIGGDDLTAHGRLDDAGKPALGWLYIQRALENISPKVARPNDGSVAALGSSPSDATSSDAGAAVGRAAAEAGLTVTYHDGKDGIDAFFAALDAGSARPRIIWIAGDDASNDLSDGPGGDEPQALIDNATKLADFVNSGGGLMSHGVEYGWLSALLPGLNAPETGSSDDLELTPAGTAAFPGLTNDDVNAGPWHNHFEGNFGGLQVLVKSNDIDDASGNDAAVIIGGAAVQLPGAISLDPASATNPVGTSHTVTATVRNSDGSPQPDVTVDFAVTAGPNSGETGSATTGADGKASFTYTGDGGPGTDTIEASFVDEGEMRRSTTATKVWEAAAPPAPPTPPATPPAAPPGPTPADLTITIKAEVLPAASSLRRLAVAAGTRMRYLITVTNNGPGVARNVALTHGAPAGSSFDSISTDTGSCSGSSTVTCSFGSLAVGQQAHVTTTATLAQAGSATATASVSASEPDPASGNNSASATTDVSAAVTGQGVPVFGTRAVPEVVSGFVCVTLPNTTECVDISTLTEIPVGSIIDTTRGRVRLTVATSAGVLETAELYQGVFQLLQSTAARSSQARSQAASVTEFRLSGGDFSKCTAQPAKAKAKKAKKKRKPAGIEQGKPRQRVRRLWGDGAGSFRTRGRYSSATVRGTVWLTEDYCNGTLIRVEQGSVTVRDLVKNRTVVVAAGKSYFAEAPARKAAKAKAKPKKKPKPARG